MATVRLATGTPVRNKLLRTSGWGLTSVRALTVFFLIFTTFNFVPEPSFRDDILEIESEITKPTAGQSERRKLDRRQRAQPSGRAGPVRRPVLASLVLLRTVDHGLHGRRPRFVELT